MKVLIFDTETTGLPTERNASILDTQKWPYIVQLSFILFDTVDLKLLECHDLIIRPPDHIEIESGAIVLHGISRERCILEGRNIRSALTLFHQALVQADEVVGHNVSFDKRMIMVECIRNKVQQGFTVNQQRKAEYCTMKQGAALCGIEVINPTTQESYFKYPKLSELHIHCFDEPFARAHNALADIVACLRCYMKMTQDIDIFDEPLCENVKALV